MWFDLVLDALDAIEDDRAVSTLDIVKAIESNVDGGATDKRDLHQRPRRSRSGDIRHPDVPKVHDRLYLPLSDSLTLESNNEG